MMAAESKAASAASTEVPKVQWPWRSGGELEDGDVERHDLLAEELRDVV